MLCSCLQFAAFHGLLEAKSEGVDAETENEAEPTKEAAVVF